MRAERTSFLEGGEGHAGACWNAGASYGLRKSVPLIRTSDRCQSSVWRSSGSSQVETAGACFPLTLNTESNTWPQAHELDHRIVGDDMQCVEITLDPQETVIAEAGTMMMMDEGIEMKTIFGEWRWAGAEASWTSCWAPASACSPGRACS
jgi:hypothetical protein